jgi:hypothetical protein
MEATSYYFHLWSKYGRSYGEAAIGMLKHPHWVAGDILFNISLYKNLLAWAFLPLLSPVTLVALPPIAVLATTSSPLLKAFGLYYGVLLAPIFFTATAHALSRFSVQRRRMLAGLVLALCCFLGGSFLRFPSADPAFPEWRRQAAVITGALPGEKEIWVQSGMLPYLDYDTHWRRIDSLSSLPKPGVPLVFYRGLKADSIEVSPEEIPSRLTALGYRKFFEQGALQIYR